MRSLWVVLILLSFGINAQVALKTIKHQNTFVQANLSLAIRHARPEGVPISICLGQAILESGHGKSKLSKENHNYFGLKSTNGKYRDFKNKSECFSFYSSILGKAKRYKSLKISDDYKVWATGLSKLGYAEDKRYSQLLISVIEKNKLYCFDFLPYNPTVSPIGRDNAFIKSLSRKYFRRSFRYQELASMCYPPLKIEAIHNRNILVQASA
jgi:flagellum-specific peptidoglycan hydrolase FlgJ